MSDLELISPANTSPEEGDKADVSPQDALRHIADQVHQDTLVRYNTLIASLEEDLAGAIYEPFSKAVDVHKQLLEELRTDIANASSLTWRDLVKHRRDTQEKVLTYLHPRLGVKLPDQIRKCFQKFFDQLQSLVSTHPDILTQNESADLYLPSPNDSLRLRFQKANVRSRRSMAEMQRNTSNVLRKLLGKEQQPAPVYQQTINVKQLITYHVQVRVPELMLELFESLQHFISQQITLYEKTHTQWTYELLDIEQSINEADYDLPVLDAWLVKEEAEAKPAEEAGSELSRRILETTESLHKALIQLAEGRPSVPLIKAEAFQKDTDALYEDLERSNTFFLGDRSLPESQMLPRSILTQRTAFRKSWHAEVSNRLTMNTRLHELRDFILRRRQRLLQAIADASIVPLMTSFNRLRDNFQQVREEAIKICEAPPTIDTHQFLIEELTPLHKKIKLQFKRILTDVTNFLRAGQILIEPGTRFKSDFHRFIDGLPEQVDLHETVAYRITEFEAPKHQYQILFRETVLSALIVSLPEQLTKVSKNLQKTVILAWEETQQIQHMVDYNLKAAFAELSAESQSSQSQADSPETEEETPHDPVEAARELIADGLSRSTDKLSEIAVNIEAPWKQLVDQVFSATTTYSVDILHNVRREDNMNDRWTNLRIRVSRYIRSLIQRAEQSLSEATSWTANLIKRGQRQARQLIKKGQSAVGVVDQSEEQWLSTLEIASDIDSLHKKLPLVYRRLFSLQPLADLDLLEGRKLDVAFVKKHYTQWKKSQTGPLLLAMPYGSGRTSFINVLVSEVYGEANITSLNLQERVPDELAFVHFVAEALDIAIDEKEPLSLDELESQIIGMKRGKKPCILVIDRFEHLMLCTPDGNRLLERILIFMSRTDNYIYWVLNISTSAWHFLEKTISPSSGFISAYRVTNIQRQSLEDIILKRHHRSGMTLHFKPANSSKTFRDFFTRSGSKRNQQEMHRNAFFERLHKLSGQNILLALLYWLRSVQFDAEEDTLFVNAISPINFSFLDTLDLPRAFTLKSFLVHGTLTLEEHMQLFKLTRTESTFIFESLLNLRIIEPTTKDPDEHIHFRIESGQPYRLHSLIVHPVQALLKKRHIIY